MKDSAKKTIAKWFWILLTAPFALVFILLLLVWLFAKIPSFEELEHPDSKLATQVLSDDPTVIRTVTRECRHAVETLSTQLGITQPRTIDLCEALGKELLAAKYARSEAPASPTRIHHSTNQRTGKPRLTRRRTSSL